MCFTEPPCHVAFIDPAGGLFGAPAQPHGNIFGASQPSFGAGSTPAFGAPAAASAPVAPAPAASSFGGGFGFGQQPASAASGGTSYQLQNMIGGT